MSLEPDEVAIREAFDRRRPAAVPPELLARVSAVPGEVPPLRSMPVRLALGIAPWLAVAAATVALVYAPRLVTMLAGPVAGTPPIDSGWTPAEPGGGFANEGIFGLPWVPALPLIAALATWFIVRRIRAGVPILQLPTRRPATARRAATRRGRIRDGLVAAVVPAVVILGPIWFTDPDPILYGSTNAVGPEVSEVTDNGTWFDDGTRDLKWLHGAVPNYVFRVEPGHAFSTIVSIRNDWPVPITVLGLHRDEGVTTDSLLAGTDAVQSGLGLLRDPVRIDAAPGDVVAFRPVTLDPGEEVALVVAWVAGSCADPTAEAVYHDTFSTATRPDVTLVYDVFGWRRQGWTAPPFDMTVPVTPGCMGG